jgi:tetratricopeptide (TPR) repeat protein
VAKTSGRAARHFAAALRVGLAVACLLFPCAAFSQCSGSGAAAMHQAYEQKNWDEVARLAQGQTPLSAEDNFEAGMALAHLQRWKDAHAVLLAGERLCPTEKRFPIELGGVAFQEKRYPEAAEWLRRGLKLDPKDEYANNFAGTVYYLMGNLPAALEYWNRIGKPYIASLNFDSQLRVRRLLLDRAVAFSPAAVLEEPQLETTDVRVDGLGIFQTYNIVLSARQDGNFDAEFHALERDGFGSRLAALVSTFSGLPYETIYPSYYDMGRSAINVRSLLRWDKEKRRAWVVLQAPLRDLPQHRLQFSGDARNENWAVRRSFTGSAPVLGSLNLERQTATASMDAFTTGRFQWSLGAEFSHRNYRNVVEGSALSSSLLIPGSALGFQASVQGKPLDLPVHRFTLTTSAASDTTRLWTSPTHIFEKVQGSALAHWFPQAQSNNWEIEQRVRGGGLVGTTPFDELFMLGVERDNDLWLRGHVGTRGGKKGSSPLGDRFFLANSDVYRRLYSNGLIGIEAGPLFDVGRMGAPASGLSTSQWLFDIGVEAKLTVLGTNVVLTWGRDLRTGNNAFYGTAQ